MSSCLLCYASCRGNQFRSEIQKKQISMELNNLANSSLAPWSSSPWQKLKRWDMYKCFTICIEDLEKNNIEKGTLRYPFVKRYHYRWQYNDKVFRKCPENFHLGQSNLIGLQLIISHKICCKCTSAVTKIGEMRGNVVSMIKKFVLITPKI